MPQGGEISFALGEDLRSWPPLSIKAKERTTEGTMPTFDYC